MGKKVREYKSGDFIFAKVKGYPAWPARVQRLNGKKYFVYFYGTGEIANLPPNMIFDYAENKDKFLTKTVKRRDFNDGVKQIEHDFANNVPLEQVVGLSIGESPNPNVTANDTTANDTLDETNADTTAADETVADETSNTLNNDTAVEDSDDTGALVIDEGKPKGRKSKAESVKTPAKPVKEPKTPRGKAKRDESREDDQDDKKEEELVSRSGRKIRPKRYIDEQTEDNATLPSPAPKKRRGASPPLEKEKDKTEKDKNIKHFNAVPQSELEDLKEPFKPECIVSNTISSIKTVKGQDAKVNNNNIAPKFGKHMKTSAKRKKFIPPTKCKKIQNNDDGTNIRSNVGITNKCLDDTFYATHQLGLNVESQNDQLDKMNEVTTNVLVESSIPSDCSQSNCFTNEYFHTHNATGQACNLNIEDSLLLKHKTDTHCTQSCGNVKVVNVNRKTKTDSLGGLIFNSINLLNENNLTPCALTRESSSSTVTGLSRTQSTTSVISLKTYKNLDDKSFTVNHNIPSGAEYFELFNNSFVKKICTPVVMTVKYGDIGFNMKYSDYMKTAGPMEHVNPEVNDTINKIITMYPEENRKLLRK